MTSIRLTGIRASGRHGASPGERDVTQEFVVDLEVDVEPSSDDLAATTDYRDVVRTTRDLIEGQSFELLETMAQAVARGVHGLGGVRAVHAVVHKPDAAKRLGIDDVAAEATIE